MKFTEERLEEAIIELLGQEGYPHVLGRDIARDPVDVLIKEDLQNFLVTQYANDNITPGEIESIIRKLETFPASDLYESNKGNHGGRSQPKRPLHPAYRLQPTEPVPHAGIF